MLVLAAGIICIILSLVLAKLAILWIIGWILVAVGVLLLILGYAGHPVYGQPGRRYYW